MPHRRQAVVRPLTAPIFPLVPQEKLPKRLYLARDEDLALDGAPGWSSQTGLRESWRESVTLLGGGHQVRGR